MRKIPFIFESESRENENSNKINDLKIFDNFVVVRHVLFVDGRQPPLARQETKRKPHGVPTQGF